MIVTYKYKLYNEQDLYPLNNLTNIAGNIYNHCIALHKKYYKLFGKHLNKFQLQKHLTKLKKRDKYSYWKSLGSQAIQELTERIEEGYQKFFKWVTKKSQVKSGIPTFKKSLEYPSFKMKGYVGYKLNNNRITINKKSYKFKKYRDFSGEIKTCTIKRNKYGEFFVIISVEESKFEKLPHTGNAVGMDFGLKIFLTTSDNEQIIMPQYFKKSLKQVRKLNRILSHKKLGSNNRKRAKIKLSKLQEKIANQRNDWQWKTAYDLVKRYDIIKIEDLNISAMKKLWGRKVSDLAYASFVNKVEHLCNKYEKELIKIDRFFPSSKTCSSCGNIDSSINKDIKDLNNRIYHCKECHLIIDRDYNAAINILNYREQMKYIKRVDKHVQLSDYKTSVMEANHVLS